MNLLTFYNRILICCIENEFLRDEYISLNALNLSYAYPRPEKYIGVLGKINVKTLNYITFIFILLWAFCLQFFYTTYVFIRLLISSLSGKSISKLSNGDYFLIETSSLSLSLFDKCNLSGIPISSGHRGTKSVPYHSYLSPHSIFNLYAISLLIQVWHIKFIFTPRRSFILQNYVSLEVLTFINFIMNLKDSANTFSIASDSDRWATSLSICLDPYKVHYVQHGLLTDSSAKSFRHGQKLHCLLRPPKSIFYLNNDSLIDYQKLIFTDTSHSHFEQFDLLPKMCLSDTKVLIIGQLGFEKTELKFIQSLRDFYSKFDVIYRPHPNSLIYSLDGVSISRNSLPNDCYYVFSFQHSTLLRLYYEKGCFVRLLDESYEISCIFD